MKKIKLLTIILTIVLVSIIGFVGVFVQAPNRIDNIIKEYTFTSNLEGKRVVLLKVNQKSDNEDKTEEEKEEGKTESVTEEKKYTKNDYEVSKKTIENRLKYYGASDYTVSVNKETGTIKVELDEDENTEFFESIIVRPADFEIAKEDGTVLINTSAIKSVDANYDYINDGYQAYIEVKLNNDGKDKLAEITNKYAILSSEIDKIEADKKADESDKKENSNENAEVKENETTEGASQEKVNTTEENKDEGKKYKETVTLKINDKEYDVYEVKKNKIKILVGSSTTSDSTLKSNVENAYDLKGILESGLYEVNYEGTDKYIASQVQEDKIRISAIILAVFITIALIFLILKFKVNGLLSAFSYIGQAAILLLLIRYTNVALSIEGLLGIVITAIIDYILIYRILDNIKQKINIKEAISEAYKKTFVRIVPIYVLAIVACFTKWTSFVSFGLVMFWGIIVIAIFNITLTKLMLKINASK